MRILFTGANGNLGQEFTNITKYSITPVHRHNWEELDSFLSETDVVIHAASDLHSSIANNPTRLLHSNLLSTAQLLEKANRYSIKRLIFISSCAVYGNSICTKETNICQPQSINGMTKRLNEKMIEEFCLKNSIPFQILRLFNTYGGNDNFSIINHIKKSLNSAKPFILNNRGIAQRDFIHVTDVATIIEKLISQESNYSYLNIGTGNTVKISDIIDIIKNYNPDLKLSYRTIEEAEYSRANIDRLNSLITYTFTKLEDHLTKQFS